MAEPERKLTIKEACIVVGEIAGDDEAKCHSSLCNWIHRGVKSPDGTVVTLAHTKIGGQYRITRSAISEFLDALTGRKRK